MVMPSPVDSIAAAPRVLLRIEATACFIVMMKPLKMAPRYIFSPVFSFGRVTLTTAMRKEC